MNFADRMNKEGMEQVRQTQDNVKLSGPTVSRDISIDEMLTTGFDIIDDSTKWSMMELGIKDPILEKLVKDTLLSFLTLLAVKLFNCDVNYEFFEIEEDKDGK